MIDDNLISAKAAMKQGDGAWYRCPKGHHYLIGDCTQPYHSGVCPECGKNIGGEHGQLHAYNELSTASRDETKHGYILGKATGRENIPSGERSLSPASVVILHALIHLTFIWSSLSKHQLDEKLASLVNGGLDDPKHVPSFFIQHLEKDIQDLTRLTGKNFEQATFIIHLVIKSLIQTVPNKCKIPTILNTREMRSRWEVEFDKQFIHPILSSLNVTVESDMKLVLDEERIANNPLLRIVYERDDPEPNNHLPHLWHFRTLVNLQHFSQIFSTVDVSIMDKCPLTKKMLKDESNLFATRYLADIVQLQHLIRGKFLYRIDRCEAKSMKIRDFITNSMIENTHEAKECERLIESVRTAWALIGEDVKQNGRLKLDSTVKLDITFDTSIIYLFPSTKGEGLLITSLMDYLVVIHNSFVHTYRDGVKRLYGDKIPLRDVISNHLIEYQDQFHSLLLSHAHYSLGLGNGAQVTYDFEGFEKQFVEQFIRQKPLIIAENLHFEFRPDACKLSMFEKVRHKVPQIDLMESVWKVIRGDLDNLETLNSVLITLDVVIGFLASAGGDPEQKLSSYLYDILKYPESSNGFGPLKSGKAECVLLLKHVISFWGFVSREKAKQFSLQGHIPFYSLKDEFREYISEEDRKEIMISCAYFPVEKVMSYLHEFTIFFVAEMDLDQKNYGLMESLEVYANENNLNLPEGFISHFPRGIKISQTAASWAVLAQKEHAIDHQ